MQYHIVGIGGAGMSAIAHILLDQGHTVNGSDLAPSSLSDALVARGAQVFRGHDGAFIAGADALVVTSAARADHPELAAARAAGVPLLKRADLWREWSQRRSVIAIAGTHGKTTTTAMIAMILSRAGLNPGFSIGAAVADLGTNARWGAADAPLVLEADEYDRTFLSLTPQIAVILNVEWDHVDIYPSAQSYDQAFEQFAAGSRVCVCHESWRGAKGRQHHEGTTITYGSDSGCTWAIGPTRVEHGRSYSSARLQGSIPTEVRFGLQVPGGHNVQNAVAALAVAHLLGLNLADASLALLEFRGAARRFELKGEAGGVTVVDDYAHHPTEARATLEAARARYGGRRLLVYLQPHTYSRTRALLNEWPAAFGAADLVLVGEIYGAREAQGADEPISGNLLAERIARAHPHTHAVGDVQGAVSTLLELLQPGDVLLTLGAGDGYLVGERVLEQMQKL